MEKIDYAIKLRALDIKLSECGDVGFIKEFDGKCFITLIDVLGHGSDARKVAIQAVEFLEENYQETLVDIINGLHEHLRGTRGAVVFCCLLENKNGRLQYSGVGNITARIFGINQTRLVSKDGIIGYGNIKPIVKEIELLDKDILVLHSDGITEHFEAIECKEILIGDAETITTGILNKYGTKIDDASCIALKYFNKV